MCCTLQPAKLSKTIVYAGHAIKDERRVAVLAYQNRAHSLGANAMVLPIPTDGELGPQNIIDTRVGGHFLEHMDEMARQRMRSLSMKSASPMIGSSFQVFDSGSYTVIIAPKPSMIPLALMAVPTNKRPIISDEFLYGYSEIYPNCPIAVCCWEGQLKSEPLLWWYEPRDERLFLPTMDAHDGRAPQRGNVSVDHTLLWDNPAGEFRIEFDGNRSVPSQIQELMPKRVSVLRPNGQLPNGDCWVENGTLQRLELAV